MAGVDKDMRGERPGQADAGEGLQPRQREVRGLFGRIEIGFFCGRDWDGVGIEEFIAMPDAYLRWYPGIRIKSDLDYRSPMQYRRDLGLAA